MSLVVSQTFDDTEALSHALKRMNVSAMQVSRGSFEGKLTRYGINDWLFQHVAFNAGHTTCRGDSPASANAIMIPVRFHPHSRILGKPVREGTIAVYGRNSEHADVSHAGVRHMVIVLPEDTFPSPISGSHVIEVDVELARASRALLEGLQSTAEHCPERLSVPAVKRAIIDELAAALSPAVGLHEARTHAGRPELPRGAIIARIKDVLDAYSGEPVFADDLCKAAGVSVPTLRRIFIDWYGMPPARYLLMRRYYLVRARLRSGEARTVRDAAEACGFWDMSRFSAGYRKLFATLPSGAIADSRKRV